LDLGSYVRAEGTHETVHAEQKYRGKRALPENIENRNRQGDSKNPLDHTPLTPTRLIIPAFQRPKEKSYRPPLSSKVLIPPTSCTSNASY
jgi:hypothetical protein